MTTSGALARGRVRIPPGASADALKDRKELEWKPRNERDIGVAAGTRIACAILLAASERSSRLVRNTAVLENTPNHSMFGFQIFERVDTCR